jgi:2,3-bisphosphoglycerate-dependent phosphoglycerate mutase
MTEPMQKEYAKLRRRPFLTPVWLTALGGLLALVLLTWAVLSASTTTVYVLRHAEQAEDGSKDPPLSPVGQARAERLRELLGGGGAGIGIDGIVVSGLRRSQDTAKPLADARGIHVVVTDAGQPGETARRALHDFRGGRVVVIGHSNTVPAIVEALSGQAVPAMEEDDFSTIYVVARPRYSPASVSVLQLP